MNVPAPVAAIGRVLLAAIFILAGLSKFGSLDGTTGYIASQGLPVPGVLAFAAALVEVVGGVLLAIGYQTRLAALVLAAFTLVATVIFHAFWAAPADQAMVQQLMFMKNLAIVGGLLFVLSLGAGPLSVDTRAAAR